MSLKQFLIPVLVAVVAFGVLAVDASPASASDLRERLEARRAERAAEREARRVARETERAARRAEREQEDSEEEASACSCRARLRFSRPSLQFRSGTLVFVPRVDVSVSSRGDFQAPGWTATLAYDGSTSYESDDVTAPAGTSFGGEQDVFSGSCGTHYDFDGLQLSAVPLAGITSSLVGLGQELDGVVRMNATLSGCGFDSEQRQFGFRLRDLVDLRTSGWRTVR